MANWNSFNEFDSIIDSYMLPNGEGNSMASQIVTAVNKLVYKWYNDGDIYDNTHYLEGWCNDLSSYANWLYEYANIKELAEIFECKNGEEYSDLLYRIAKKCLNEDFLSKYVDKNKVDSIYEASGPFKYIEYEEDEDEYFDEEDEDEE